MKSIIASEGAQSKQAVQQWVASTERKVAKSAMTLQQQRNGVCIPPNGWKCAKCDLTSNLWLNLTDGMVLCGRANWDGTGGNGHALEHYRETGYPLAVKLGTITRDLDSAGESVSALNLGFARQIVLFKPPVD